MVKKASVMLLLLQKNCSGFRELVEANTNEKML
jgi:hypothetical protein